MYLHPLIHTDLIRGRQRELSQLRLSGSRGSRSLPGKRAAAALGVLLVATVAALALTSGALAATAKKPSHPATGAKGTGWKVVQDASGKITIRLGKRVIYVYWPAPAKPLTGNIDTSSDCENFQLNCTSEQNCQYWGVCDATPTTSSNDGQEAKQDSSASEGSADGSGQADSVELAPLFEVANDSSAGEAATETVATVADPYQYEYEDC